jgi:hypothetical protein
MTTLVWLLEPGATRSTVSVVWPSFVNATVQMSSIDTVQMLPRSNDMSPPDAAPWPWLAEEALLSLVCDAELAPGTLEMSLGVLLVGWLDGTLADAEVTLGGWLLRLLTWSFETGLAGPLDALVDWWLEG